MFHQILIVTRGKGAGETGVVECLGLEALGFLLVGHRPEPCGPLFGVVAGDVLVDVYHICATARLEVTDRGTKEGERLYGDGLFLRFLDRQVHLGVFADRVETAFLANMKEHFLVEGLQQLVAFLMVMEGGETEGVPIGDGSVEVLVQGPLGR